MHDHKPSRTALGVAVRRAAHQLFDHPRVFNDPLAVRILGRDAPLDADDASASLRAFLVARSRYAEDQLAEAVQRGVRQYVVLGAGLDTFAYRNPYASLRVFEVDHPSTQAWKRDLLESAGIAIPPEATFVPVDFERQLLSDALRSAGLRTNESAFFSWLGVVPYLTDDAFTTTLRYIAAMPPPSGVVFDYGADRSTLSPREQEFRDALAARVAAAGEPFQLFFKPPELHARLERLGFRNLEDLTGPDINARYGSAIRGTGGHLLSATL